ncbi:MAG: HAD family hydrolase [Sulfuricurvum sp.]
MEITIPGSSTGKIKHLVLDYNGTIACGGKLIEGVAERLIRLSGQLSIHVLTADTYGSVHAQCAGLGVEVHVIGKGEQDKAKQAFVISLGLGECIAIGNGRNDVLMLKDSFLGFALMQEEGLSVKTMVVADVVFKSILDALDAIIEPNRLIATLRN